MRRILILLLAGVSAPAFAQHSRHSTPPAPAANATCTPEHAAMGHCKLPAQGQAPAEPRAGQAMPAPQQQPQPDPHAGHQMPVQQPTADPHAHHPMPAQQEAAPTDPHAGHQMSAQPTPTDPHAGHDMGAVAGPEPQPGPPPQEAFSGPRHAADAYWGQQESQRGRNILREEHGGLTAYKIFFDRAETRFREGRDGYLLDAQAWYGGDIDKLWFKTEIEGAWGRKVEHAEVQALWSHAIDPWFDIQAGVRFDPQPGPNRSHLVLGVQGLAPYWWEVEGALFLSNMGDVTARAEAEYDLLITQKLILQPRAEIDLSLQDVPELAIGSGLTYAALGLRLRYQISPLIAPYVGVEYERAFGDTRDALRAAGEDPGGFNLLAGIRFWF